jgi:Uma2 family endonuclease
VIADERGMDFVNAGSTTLTRRDLDRGFEPDTCIYVRNAARVRGKQQIELPSDPAPDFVIEVEITRSSIAKMDIFRAVGIPEVWRYDGLHLRVFVLEGIDYVERAESAVLAGLTAEIASQFLEDARSETRAAWSRKVREWARRQKA